MKKVLVFPCGSEIGLEIHRSLEPSKNVLLFGASSVRDHGEFVYRRYIPGIPRVDEDGFAAVLDRVVEEHGIDFVYPAHDDVTVKLSALLEGGSLRCGLLSPPARTCRICRSKKETYERFGGVLPTPEVFSRPAEVTRYPVFLKPDRGQGSEGTAVASSPEELEFLLRRDPRLLILEHLPGKEYTVDCFTDRRGALRFAGGRERRRIRCGISVNTAAAEDPRFAEYAEAINAGLPFRGGWFFQLKEREGGELVLLEIGPRVSGTMGYFRNLGVNIPYLTFFDALERDVTIQRNTFALEMDRAFHARYRTDLRYDHVYVDFDDTILVGDEINARLVAFLVGCLGRGVQLHLVTRHAGDIRETLRSHRLDGFFHSCASIGKSGRKSDHILEESAILIDDSFADREDVLRNRRIPVFDVTAAECLYNF